MKKWLTLGLSLLAVVAALSLSACGQQESAAPESGGATSAPTTSGETATPTEGGAGSTTEGGTEATPAEPATGGGQ